LVDNLKIAIIGDDDLVSITLFLVGKPKEVYVVEVDNEISKAIEKESSKSN